MKRTFVGLVLSLFLGCGVQADGPTFSTTHYTEPHAKGLQISEEHHKRFLKSVRYVSFLDAADAIPKSEDLSAAVSLPENQGSCGSCWDFSLTKALRSEFMVAKKDPGVLEFNYLLNNCGPGPKMSGCNGGSFSAAQSLDGGAGPGLNSQNPYSAKKGTCKHLPVQASAVSYSMVGDSKTGPTFKDLAYAMSLEHHMLSIDVAAAQGQWENYANGIYNGCKGTSKDVDHMINVVGYDCETSVDAHGNCLFDKKGKPVNGDGYLLIMNNWGENWGTQAGNGHRGYMKTRMYGKDGLRCNAVANDALLFEIKK